MSKVPQFRTCSQIVRCIRCGGHFLQLDPARALCGRCYHGTKSVAAFTVAAQHWADFNASGKQP